MRVLICGSRTWADPYPIHTVLNGYLHDGFGVTVINGGAQGADTIAHEWAAQNRQQRSRHPADWKQHGKAAGPIRNTQMLRDSEPEVIWAFVDKPLEESRGTLDMVTKGKAANVDTYVVTRA